LLLEHLQLQRVHALRDAWSPTRNRLNGCRRNRRQHEEQTKGIGERHWVHTAAVAAIVFVFFFKK
jgi:hypothetical protein